MAPQLNLEECEDWLNQALDCHGFVNITSPVDNFRGRFFNVESPEFPQNALTYIEHLDRQEPKGIYLRVTSTSEVPETGRGGADISLSLPSLWLDMDIAGPGHKTSKHNPMPLPATESDCWHILNHAKVPAPTLWIHSGGGLYPYWFFKHPIDISDPAVRAEWDGLSEALHLAVHRAAADLGFRYDMGTHDLARVLRIPGTVNRKVPDAPTQARSFHSDDSSKTYVPADLRAGILDALELWPDTTPVRVAPTQPARQINPGDLSPGDDFNARVDFFRDILEPIGWQFHSQRGEEVMLTRPGKSVRDGESATLNYKGSGKLYVFSTDTDFPVEEPISAFHAYALLHHNADHTSAARDLRRQGYGTQRNRSAGAGFGGTAALTVPPISSNGHREHVSAVIVDDSGEVIPPDDLPPGEPVTGYAPRFGFTDVDNARRVARRIGRRRLLLVKGAGWAVYDKDRWEMDDHKGHRATRIIVETLEEVFADEAKEHSDEPAFGSGGRPVRTELEKFNAHRSASLNAQRLDACLRLFGSEPGTIVSLSDFDADPTKVNVRNGYLDLVTGELEPHDPKHLCRAKINVDYDPAARSELWERCMEQWHPDEELRHVLHKIMGYTLSIDTSVQGFFIHTGTGSNGKSVFFDVLHNLMADYSQIVPRRSLMARKYDSAATPEILRMAGKRMLYCSELKVGEVVDSAAVKGLTGGDVQVARDLYSGYQEFTPTGKLHFSTNHPPGIPDDDASWRRVWVFKWDTKITEAEADPALAYKLKRNEAQGILAWLVRGYQLWAKEGVSQPASMRKEVGAYRLDDDPFESFVQESLERVEPTGEGEEVWVATQELFNAYLRWCVNSNMRYPMNKLSFSKAMVFKKFEKKDKTAQRGFSNVKVIKPPGDHWIGEGTPIFRYR